MEEENFLRIEKESLKLIFGNVKFLEGLEKEKFDFGIGGLSMVETILFRHLNI